MRCYWLGWLLLILLSRVETLLAVELPEHAGPQFTDEDRNWWSLQPVTKPRLPEVSDPRWPRTAIDYFILARLDAEGIAPSKPANPEVFVRRIYYSLWGLPPTLAQASAFVDDRGREGAVSQLVDRLLADPAYGEHWAGYWLDLVRYADSDGYKADGFRPRAWRYRDYVIAALNDDKPYDRFLQEQLAGDELAPSDPQAIVATGFLRHGIYEYNQRDVAVQWQAMLNDITDTTADALLGLGMSCARCHDHKFDPILQQDYYRLQAFFAGLALRDDVTLATAAEVATYEQRMSEWERATAELRQQLHELEAPKLADLAREALIQFAPELEAIAAKPAAARTAYERQLAHLIQLQVLDRQANLATRFKGAEQKRWEAIKQRLASFDQLKPKPLPTARAASDVSSDPPPVRIPGGAEVPPGFLSILAPQAVAIESPAGIDSSGRRTALARWITRADHPLTARVIVNRVWQYHFGTGLVATSSDFGRLGEPPSHPQLLDWLAANFVEQGWSLKWLQRQILTSATYRQSAVAASPSVVRIDPANRWLARQRVRRLRAEQIRDAMLAVSGELNQHRGGPPIDLADSRRRSIYGKVLRNQRDELLDVFDFPDRITGIEARSVTTTSAQSLWMINGRWVQQRAEAFAERLAAQGQGSLIEAIRHGYRDAFSRAPTIEEEVEAVTFIGASRVAITADDLVDFCHVLLTSSEFQYVD